MNLKAEIEIMALHDKLDAMRTPEIAEMTGVLTQIVARLERLETVAPRSGSAKAASPGSEAP